MARRSKLPTNGDGAAMARTSATAAAYAPRTKRPPDRLDEIAADFRAGTLTLADAMAAAHKHDAIEGPLFLAVRIGTDAAFDAAETIGAS
jgi:hypothetical protein